ncbi:Hvo_1808 family surface protein [Halomicrobium salinisoli]|uniref:Hvo_1808 family surface protein n=1 Tax=Halomicrobium salinisoli TaxID=2878391 RepID=UPI001CF0579F|nr:Hvo_1808 family surface protein [Halomicrobium salinisoli]
MYRAALCAVLLVLAGCQAPGVGEGPTATETGVDAGTSESDAGTPADPESDVLGWEDGYWHNESLSITTADGLNESEREKAVARSMARVERVRGLEFRESVSVEVITRAEYRNESGRNHTETFRRFDNAKFEAMFLVGEDEDSIATQERSLGQSVLGYYDPAEEAIVIVSDSETPRLDGEGTLAHELVHALQDQHYDLSDDDAATRDAYQGRNGLIEGDASFTQRRYTERCGAAWECLPAASDGGGGGDSHFGLNFLMYFPYGDGGQFVAALHDEGGWERVNDAYDEHPDGSTEVIYPDRYSEWEPEAVTIDDGAGGDWERVQPADRPDHAVLGQSAIAAGLAYTVADEYNDSGVVGPRQIINYRGDGSVDRSDPYNYDLPAADGWAGGRLHVYERGDESAYVWKTVWTNESEAAEFAAEWGDVVEHWGGERVDDGVWVIEDGPHEDAVEIRRDGDAVTVVNAPTRSDLEGVHA